MRLFFGIILGILLTVGGAYISDSMTQVPAGSTPEQVRMVNWPVVQTKFSNLGTSIRGLWDKLTGAAPSTSSTTTTTTPTTTSDKQEEKPAEKTDNK